MCSSCGGTGDVIKSPCATCGGVGTVKKRRTLTVTVPSGVEDGSVLRLVEQGSAGEKGEPPGHLFVTLQVLPSKKFERRGNDIFVNVPISIAQAILGGTVAVPTLTGDVEVRVPTGTQPEEGQRIRGRGIKNSQTGEVGHQFLTFKVAIPK